jgi:hypothetical protein
VVYVAGLLVLVALAGVVGWRLLAATSRYEKALDTLPASTLRTTYTDWSEVRSAARGTDLDAGSSRGEVQSFLTRAYDLDLTSGSGVADSTYVLADRFGFSPLDAQWEVLGQSRKGQVDVMRLDDGVDVDGVERALRRLGYTPPAGGAGSGGTWVGGEDLVARLSGALTPVQQNVVVLPDQQLVLMSDIAAYVSSAAEAARGDERSLLDDDTVADLAGHVEDAVSAVQWTSTFVCEDLSMGQADGGDRAEGDRLVGEAGGAGPVDGFVMAQRVDRSLLLGLHFERSDQASRNLQPRVELASGPAPGQGGTFPDRFTIASGKTSGSDVLLTTRPTGRTDQVLSDLSSGPLLLATC